MPGFILHLLHGKMFLDQYSTGFSDLEKKQFTMGLLMPDSNKAAKKWDNDNSHFLGSDQTGKILQYPNMNLFPYLSLIDSPFVMGYAAHLYLDKMFFSDFFLRYVHFLDENGVKTLDEDSVKQVLLVKNNKYISVNDLFSERYLYGDYTMLNQFFIEKFKIGQVDSEMITNPVTEVDINNFEAVRQSLAYFLSESSGRTDTNVFPVEELEKSIERYAFGFGQWIDGVKNVIFQMRRIINGK